MQSSDVFACSFSCWYSTLEKVTFKSKIIQLPQEFVDYLSADNLVLPKFHETKDYDNSNDSDWDEADSTTPELEAPDFAELDNQIKSAISELGGQAFIKLNWSSPKDATWISFNNSLKCFTPQDVYLLLKSSDFVQHDLTQPFKDCVDQTDILPSVKYELILRKWIEINPENEFRCFVRNRNLIAICQREDSQFCSHIEEQKNDIIRDVTSFYLEQLAEKFPLENYVFDVVRERKDRVCLVDLNPFGRTTDALLFDWDQEPLCQLVEASSSNSSDNSPEFRYISKDSGICMNPLRRYCVPEDFLHLSTGQDPYKLLDFLKLRSNYLHSSEEDSD